MLDSPNQVIHSLLRYTDWWQPSTTSILQVGPARRGMDLSSGMRDGLLETLDERTELSRRMLRVEEVDRHILFLWYVQQLSAQDIARTVGVSRRQCFRRRARAIRALIEAAQTDEPIGARRDEAGKAGQPPHAA